MIDPAGYTRFLSAPGLVIIAREGADLSFLQRVWNDVNLQLALMAVAVVLELAAYAWQKRGRYCWATGVTSLPLLLAERFAHVGTLGIRFAVYALVAGLTVGSKIRLEGWTSWIVYFFLADFIYYGAHRCHHVVRILWANHSVHHSITELNALGGMQLGFVPVIAGNWLFGLPFVALGFDANRLNTGFGIVIAYQIFIHTEVIRTLGPLEFLLQTPSRHRVHHGTNPEYRDKNFGGVTMLFDYLFGTAQREIPGVVATYGLVQGQPFGRNPLVHGVRGYVECFRFYRESLGRLISLRSRDA